MASCFDAVLIGAGPAAIAALAFAPPDLRIGVVTGARPEPAKPIHPKIAAVAFEHRERPGLAEPLGLGGRGAGLFSTAAEGGLANYWGQQFVRYREGDPWPRDVFADYRDYVGACEAIEALFSISPAHFQAAAYVEQDYWRQTPRLVVGSRDAPSAGLYAMRHAFRSLAAEKHAELVQERVLSMARERDAVLVKLGSGEMLRARSVLLAAGVVGSLRLIMSSCPDVTAYRFVDHAPYMLQTMGLGRIAPFARDDGLRHFNAATLEREGGGLTRLFASVYRMADAPISVLLAALGLPPMLRGVGVPALVDILSPVQVWTESSKARVAVEAGGRSVAEPRTPDLASDSIAMSFVSWLRAGGVKVRVTHTAPGLGFHYHAAEVSTGGAAFRPAQLVLDGQFGGQVTYIDAGALREIGCRPPTLTAMAAAAQWSKAAWSRD